MQIELSKSQCKNIAEFMEWDIFEAIRNDTDIDNIDWLVDMCNAYEILRKAGNEDAE